MIRLAVITTHPVQYYAPWFRHIAATSGIDLRVFYLWDFGVTEQVDPAFKARVRWDIPLLDGYPHEFVPNNSRRPGTTSFWGIDNPLLGRSLRAFQPSAALCLGYNYATFARLLLAQPRYPLLLRGDSHRLIPPRGWKASLKRGVLTALFRQFSAFLYVGQANRQYYKLHGAPDHKLFFCPHAVDNDRFTAARSTAAAQAADWRRALGIPTDHRVILFAGKFEAKKRPLDLLVAFRRAAPTRASLLFVGSGPLDNSLRREAEGLGNVYITPFQNQTLMPRTYAAADIMVLPSHGPSETWGLSVNEAMCLGRPVVVSSHVGCGLDLVSPGKTGWIFPAGDVAALAATLTEALADPERLATYGEEAAHAVGQYSYTEATAGLCRALQAVTPYQRIGPSPQSRSRSVSQDSYTDSTANSATYTIAHQQISCEL